MVNPVYAGGCASFIPGADNGRQDVLGSLVLPTGPKLSDVCILCSGWLELLTLYHGYWLVDAVDFLITIMYMLHLFVNENHVGTNFITNYKHALVTHD